MKLAKKITTISTLIATGIVSLLLIMLLFDILVFTKINTNMMFTFTCFAVGGFFSINSLNMINKSKVLGWVSLGLILLSVFLIVLSIWIDVGNDIYFDITLSLGLLSVLFNIIVSSGLSLGKSKIFWQVIVYVIVGVTEIIATLGIFSVINLGNIITFFLMMIILSVVGVIILKIFSKKILSDLVEENKNMIKISKVEYMVLIEKSKKYDELMQNNKDN